MITLGFFEKLWIEGRSGHLKKNGANAVDSAEIIWIGLENLFEFSDSLFADIFILLGGSTGNVLAGICGGEIEACIEETRIKVLGLLHILDGRVILPVLNRPHPFVKKVASLEFVAARKTRCKHDQRQESRGPAE